MDRMDKITREIEGIETLLVAIKEDLNGLRDVHPGFVAVLLELELLSNNLKDIKTELIQPFQYTFGHFYPFTLFVEGLGGSTRARGLAPNWSSVEGLAGGYPLSRA